MWMSVIKLKQILFVNVGWKNIESKNFGEIVNNNMQNIINWMQTGNTKNKKLAIINYALNKNSKYEN